MSNVPSLVVDTGNSMVDDRSTHGRLRSDAAAKDDWVLRGFEQFATDVVNVSSHDLHFFSGVLGKSEFARRAKTEPLLERLVSANTVSESPDFISPRPFVIIDVPSRQGDAKGMRVAFIGVTETTPAPPPGFKFIDPAEAAKRAATEARKKADIVVLLAKVSSEEAARIAREAADVDVVIAGNGMSLAEGFTPPIVVDHTVVAFTPFETRMIGELRFYRSADGKFTTRQRFIALDEFAIPEDPAAKRVVDAAAKAEAQARANSKSLMEVSSNGAGNKREPATINGKPLATSVACSQCHLSQYIKWANSGHGHPSEKTVSHWYEVDASCFNCHATGARMGDSTDGITSIGLPDVQCEACHGPGVAHVAKPAKGYGRIADMKPLCISCHTSETSPGFDLNAAWTKIKH